LSREAAAFWLEVHEHLRRDAAGLETAGNDYLGGRSSPAQLAVIAAPRLHGLIAAMHGHHQIEDFHYFPAFRRAEPELAAGFDRLENEHASLGRSVEAALAALRELRATSDVPAAPAAAATQQLAAQQLAAQRYVDAAAALCRELEGHLSDEENLVVPLLERSSY
jgi:iron-sulfur cluster repair protein YtfE (RIC family)